MVAEEINLLEAQLRESFGKVVYSHKTHEKCSGILLDRLSNIKLAQIVLSAVAAGSFISVVFVDEKVSALVGAVFSTILLVLNTYTKDYDLGELAQKHKQSANILWSIRERYFSLLTDIRAGYISPSDARSIRDELNHELSVVYESSPPTFSKAYEAARKALKDNEELTFSDEEIDAFLPDQLRAK
jgi:hypothetical protein